jgi:hypothetical protein
MSKMTELASGAITAVDTVTIELGEADENLGDRHRQMACQDNRLSPARFPCPWAELPDCSRPKTSREGWRQPVA